MSKHMAGLKRVLPTWFVSSRNGCYVVGAQASAWRPYGTHHARRVGSIVTACGVSAVGWEFFWDMPFRFPRPVPTTTCHDCLAAVGGPGPHVKHGP